MTTPKPFRHLLFILCFLVTNQSLGQTSYNAFRSYYCQTKPESFYLFFEGESIDFNYEKLGEVQTYAALGSSNQILLDRIKYEAWRNCANGLILIKNGHARGSDIDPSTVEADLKYYTAIAVRIDVDSKFKTRHGNGVNMGFVQQVPQQQMQARERATGIAAVSGIALLVLTILLISNLTF